MDEVYLWPRSAVEFIKSQELADKLFRHPEELDQIGIAYYTRDLQEQIGPLRSMEFEKQLGDFLEQQLQRSKSLGILYPVKMGRNMKLLAVLAFQGDQEDNFGYSSPKSFYDGKLKQKNMTLLYSLAYEFVNSAACDQDLMHYVLSNTLGKSPVNLEEKFGSDTYGVSDVFEFMDHVKPLKSS